MNTSTLDSFSPTVKQSFDGAFEQVKEKLIDSSVGPVSYNPEWENGTGYFDNAVTLNRLSPGEMACSQCPKGRKILLIGTRLGNCVVFYRYSNDDGAQIAYNVPHEVEKLLDLSKSRLYADNIDLVLGDADEYREWLPNIGHRLEDVFNAK